MNNDRARGADDMASSDVNISGRTFVTMNISALTSSAFQGTPGFDTSQYSNVTFFVENKGVNDAIVKLEIAPNSKYIQDGIEFTLNPGEMKALVPMIFAKYTRITCKSKNIGSNTTLEITIQGQV